MSSCWISMCLFLFSYAVSEQRQMSVRALDYSYFLHAECFPLWICLSIHPSFNNSMLKPSEYFGAMMNCNTYPLHAKCKFHLYISVAIKINVLYWHVHYILSLLRHTIALCRKQTKVMFFICWKYSAVWNVGNSGNYNFLFQKRFVLTGSESLFNVCIASDRVQKKKRMCKNSLK